MTLRAFLSGLAQEAMLAAGIPASCDPGVAPSKTAQFGDYQINGALAAARLVGSKPRDLAQRILDNLALDGIAERVEIAGPGFINIHLDPQWLARRLLNNPPYASLAQNTAAEPESASQPQGRQTPEQETIVVDYSGPNLAKEMHVGHLRSTIIGDAVVRVLESLGHKVIRQNHVGDWGTQFGMLITELEQHTQHGESAALALKDLEVFYQQAKKHFDEDPAFADRARATVVKLQSGDPQVLQLWQQFRAISLSHSEEIYALLNVSLTPGDVRGESFYNDDLPVLVNELEKQGLAREDEGALVVFLDELADKKGNPSPVIVRKKGGGYLYATSDLAAVRFRVNQLQADRIMVFSDARQSLHMQQVYCIAYKAGFSPAHVSLEHHPFGTMMGDDGKPFKTRTGGTVKLAELLHEAVERAAAVIASSEALSDDEKREVARKVGIGAVKYADLSKTRTLDYVFNWQQMLSFEGNTGPYLQYAYTRIRSIFRKAGLEGTPSDNLRTLTQAGSIQLQQPQEKALALRLLQFSEVVEQVARDAMPHLLCHYLYDLASLFMSFYEACPILKPEVSETDRTSRLLLSHQVAETLRSGLDLLGIETLERM